MGVVGILPLGRTTFDMAYAGEKLASMLAALDATGHQVIGPRALLTDAEGTLAAVNDLKEHRPDQVLVLQVTFTDAAMTARIAQEFDCPLSIWAVPEPRLGGRLRLNAFCGLNLAAHTLGLAGRDFGWAYGDAGDVDLDGLLSGRRMAGRLDPIPATAAPDKGMPIKVALKGRRIGRIGTHPDGFSTCAYDPDTLGNLAGVTVEPVELDHLFDTARAADPKAAANLRSAVARDLPDLDKVDQTELDRSLRLKLALDQIRDTGGFDAFAIRCWPETFTEYGGAVCGPAAMMAEGQIPCACEADVYGALTQMLLQQVADAPVFLVDLVDMDAGDDTGVVWHCGQAPLSMADPDTVPSATIHTNRKMPLLYEFPLKPGRVTFARVSQARGTPSLVIAGGEVLRRPMAFTGTSGVVRFDRPAGEVLNDVIAAGLEHHVCLAYGDHLPTLRSVAAAMNLPLIEL